MWVLLCCINVRMYDTVKCLCVQCARAYIYKMSASPFRSKGDQFCLLPPTSFSVYHSRNLRSSLMLIFPRTCPVFATQFHLPVICVAMCVCVCVRLCVSIHHPVMRQKEKFQNKWNACTFFSLTLRRFLSHPYVCAHLAGIEEFCCPVWRNHLGKSCTICFIFRHRIQEFHVHTNSDTKCTE